MKPCLMTPSDHAGYTQGGEGSIYGPSETEEATMWERFMRWWDLREDVHVLRGLDDRMLEDMGLTRGEIRRRVTAGAGAPERPVAQDPGGGDGGEGVPWRDLLGFGRGLRVPLDT